MYDYSTTPRKNSRMPFFLIATVTLLFISLCMLSAAGVTLFTVVSSQRTGTETARAGGNNQTIADRQTVEPAREVIVLQPPDGVDYETAVLRAVYEQVNDSVVSITALATHAGVTGFAAPTDDELLPFGTGSGFVWDLDGHIVTNNHVVEGADKLQVTFSDGASAIADIVGVDEDSDLAVIKIDPSGFDLLPVVVGNMDEVFVGMRVAAIGNPFRLAGTLTSGIVSAVGRSIPSQSNFSIPDSIQTDAAINPGNSGGPLLNERGEVIGVNAQIRSEVRANSGVGFAIPIAIVERVVPALIERGRYIHSFMGISGATYSPICSQEQDLAPEQRGVLVQEVIRGGPAARAGLNGATRRITSAHPGICPSTAGGDFITAVNGLSVSTFDDILIYLARYTSPGDDLTLTVLRDGELREVVLNLAARPNR
jgi:S1-C subfamily serine protease